VNGVNVVIGMDANRSNADTIARHQFFLQYNGLFFPYVEGLAKRIQG
jgi:hypothetical protein